MLNHWENIKTLCKHLVFLCKTTNKREAHEQHFMAQSLCCF